MSKIFSLDSSAINSFVQETNKTETKQIKQNFNFFMMIFYKFVNIFPYA